MESLTLSEFRHHRPRTHSLQTYDEGYVSPQLPTPEASRSSHDAHSPSMVAPPQYDQNSQSPFLPKCTFYNSHHPHNSTATDRRNSAGRPTPTSPPYGNIDSQRPSLPPLKTVLGDSVSSPPSTPSPRDHQTQLIPREPSYTTSTYKPPALYPNKKFKVDQAPPLTASQWPPRGPIPSVQQMTSLHSRPLTASSEQLKPAPSAIPLTYEASHDSRRASVSSQAHSEPYRRNSPSEASHTSRPAYESSVFSASAPSSHSNVYAPEEQQKDHFRPSHHENYARSDDRHHPHGHSTSDHQTQIPERARVDYDRVSQGAHHTAMSYSHEDYAIPRNPMYLSHAPVAQGGPVSSYGPGLCQGSAMPFFMPNPYDSPHAKHRKRSNLPKQSTEIMKTWFDQVRYQRRGGSPLIQSRQMLNVVQNISNPYPSEEQKAMFSSATGISMTQVSNWFINHRRRCPELRDKREKGRSDGRESEI